MASHVLPEAALSFTQADLERYLAVHDPRQHTLPNTSHVATIPGRDDLLLRWTQPTGRYFPSDPNLLSQHQECYEERLGALAARELVIPTHASFRVDECPRLQRPTIYTVVEKIEDIVRLDRSGDDEAIAWLGHTLLDHIEKDVEIGDPYIWDIYKHHQCGKRDDGRVVLLDLDHYLTRDPRQIFPRMLAWTNKRHGPYIELHRRAMIAKRTADEHYQANTNNCATKVLWPVAGQRHDTPIVAESEQSASGTASVRDLEEAIVSYTQTLTGTADVLTGHTAIDAAYNTLLAVGDSDTSPMLVEALAALQAARNHAEWGSDALRRAAANLAAYTNAITGRS